MLVLHCRCEVGCIKEEMRFVLLESVLESQTGNIQETSLLEGVFMVETLLVPLCRAAGPSSAATALEKSDVKAVSVAGSAYLLLRSGGQGAEK